LVFYVRCLIYSHLYDTVHDFIAEADLPIAGSRWRRWWMSGKRRSLRIAATRGLDVGLKPKGLFK
jgi:hypothetical protein